MERAAEWLLAAHKQPWHTKRYSDLDAKRKKERVALLSRLAAWVACGENPDAILRDAKRGPRNRPRLKCWLKAHKRVF